MDPLLICNHSYPENVFDDDNVHYFFWSWEIGVTYVKLWKWNIPIFPLKNLDYEPVKEIKFKNNHIIITRFHYEIFIYFNNLNLKNGKPIIDFAFGSHSPLAYTKMATSDIGTIQRKSWKGSSAEEIDAFELLFGMYSRIVKGKIKVNTCKTKSYGILRKKVPEDVRFIPNNMKALIWIGSYPDKVDLNKAGFSMN